jgi:hypothetical protein
MAVRIERSLPIGALLLPAMLFSACSLFAAAALLLCSLRFELSLPNSRTAIELSSRPGLLPMYGKCTMCAVPKAGRDPTPYM